MRGTGNQLDYRLWKKTENVGERPRRLESSGDKLAVGHPEIAGLIQPTVVSYRMREKDDETGFFVEQRKPIPERVNRAVNRIHAWVNLQRKNNSNKKVAIFYWNYPPGSNISAPVT